MKLPGGWKNVDLDHPREVDHVERSSGFYGTADRFSIGIPRRAKLSDKCRHLRRLNGGHQIDIQCGAPDTARGRGHGPSNGITYLQAVKRRCNQAEGLAEGIQCRRVLLHRLCGTTPRPDSAGRSAGRFRVRWRADTTLEVPLQPPGGRPMKAPARAAAFPRATSCASGP